MILAPGGFAWLLRHEVRLALRGTGARRRWISRAVPLLLLAVLPAAGGIALAFGLAAVQRHGRHALAAVGGLSMVGTGIVALLVLMVSSAAVAVLRTFHDRGDLDLLLAAPLPPARVLAAKAIGVTVSVATPFVVLVVPFALTSAVLGFPRWLGLPVMVAVDATLATALAIALVAVLFAAVGPRRARVGVQLAAALLGASVFLVSQSPSLAPGLAHRLYAAVAGRWPPPLDWPARAATGQPLPLAAMVALAVAAAWLAARVGAPHLAAAGRTGGGTAAARTTTVRFRAGLLRILVTKDLRLIARDPELITQVALRLVYVIPIVALLARSGPGIDPGPAVAGATTALAALLASSLAWIVIAAEDAPDLLAAAPRLPAAIARAKLVAATIVPVVLVAVVALVAAAAGHGRAAAVIAGMGVVAALTAALLQAWFGRRAPRSAFSRRQAQSFAVAVGEVVLAGAWSGTANLLVRGSPWAVAPALLAALILAGAVEARKDVV